MFFFDESQKCDKLCPKNDGHLNFDNKGDFGSFLGLSIGIKESSLESINARFLSLEHDYVSKYRGNKEEFKSTDIKNEQFKCGFKTFKEATRIFYGWFFDFIIDIKPIIQINCINKMGMYLRRIIMNYHDPLMPEGDFFYILSKFFLKYSPESFFTDIVSDIDKTMKSLIRRLRRTAFLNRKIERLELENKAFRELSSVLERKCYFINNVSECKFPTIFNPDGLVLLLKELNIPKSDVSVIIDGDKVAYPEFSNFFKDVSSGDSKTIPMIRVADHLVGLFGRMARAMNNDHNRTDVRDPIDPEAEKERLRLLSEKWFDIDEETFDLYQKAHRVFIKDHRHHWTVMTMDNNDDASYFLSLLKYFGNFASYSKYLSYPLSKRNLYFENLAIECGLQRYEPPFDPIKALHSE